MSISRKKTKGKRGQEWLLLMHQLPPQPDAFRVKIWRNLQRMGAISIKNSVYVLPKNAQAEAALAQAIKDIEAGGGDAFLCDASFLSGIDDDALGRQFNAERDNAYGAIEKDTTPLLHFFEGKKNPGPEKLMKIEHSIGRLRRQLNEVVAIDYFSAKGRNRAEGTLAQLEKKVQAARLGLQPSTPPSKSLKDYQGKTWVTRRGLYVDRLASAWLIQRFIDKKAKFKFVDANTYKNAGRDVTFDMFEAEFSHHGDLCTFETLIRVFHLREKALNPIAEIIHDIDLNDHKYDREETAGIHSLIKGLASAESDDFKRLARASSLFDDLLSTFRFS